MPDAVGVAVTERDWLCDAEADCDEDDDDDGVDAWEGVTLGDNDTLAAHVFFAPCTRMPRYGSAAFHGPFKDELE